MFDKRPTFLWWFMFGCIVVLAFLIGYLPAFSAPFPRSKAMIERAAGQRDMVGCAIAPIFRHRVLVYPQQFGSFCGGHVHRSEPILEILGRHRQFGAHVSLRLCRFSSPNIRVFVISCK